MELNDEQKIAAEVSGSHFLVLAGPGTGKTTTLIGRYKHLLATQVPASKILCCTFSKSASDQIKSRISKASDLNVKSLPIGTFHALSLRILRSIGSNVGVGRDFQIWAKDWERVKVAGSFVDALIQGDIFKNVGREDRTAQKALEYIDNWRENLLDPEDASIRASEAGDSTAAAHAEVYRLFEEYLNEENKIDFPRMVQWACKSLEKDAEKNGDFASQFTHILVDEFQDINLAQKALIDHLVRGGGQLWAVGDDFQAIYGWRGSDVRYLLKFTEHYPGSKIISLVRNYRSGKRIIHAANNLSNNLKERYEKELVASRKDVGDITFSLLDNDDTEALEIRDLILHRINSGVAHSEIAVLARTNKLPAKVVYSLIKAGLPVDLKGGVEAFSGYEARMLLTAIAISSEQKGEGFWTVKLGAQLSGFSKKLVGEEWGRRVKALTTFITKRPPKTILDDAIEARAQGLENLRDYILEFDGDEFLFRVLKALDDANDGSERIFIGTVHSAKGLEWDTVAVIGWENGIMPQRQSTNPRVYEEERRVAYVAITRAKNCLFLTAAEERDGRKLAVSPFIHELLGKDLDVDVSIRLDEIKEQKSTPTRPKKSTAHLDPPVLPQSTRPKNSTAHLDPPVL
ncbi:ATP-dependent helicase, partial [bacterium]|nr:ATP-dependent helicase [bacterium]